MHPNSTASRINRNRMRRKSGHGSVQARVFNPDEAPSYTIRVSEPAKGTTQAPVRTLATPTFKPKD